MAGSVNKVILLGNVGRDPDIRTTQSGSKIGNLSIATSESWKDKATGERKENTQWHRVVIFSDPIVDIIEKYVRKGSKLFIEGQLETRKWTDKDGKDQYTTEVVLRPFSGGITLLDTRDSSGPPPHDGSRDERTRDYQAPAQSSHGYDADLDDDIPF